MNKRPDDGVEPTVGSETGPSDVDSDQVVVDHTVVVVLDEKTPVRYPKRERRLPARYRL